METDLESEVLQIIWPDLILFLFILSIALMTLLISKSIWDEVHKSFDDLTTQILIKGLFCYPDREIQGVVRKSGL